MPSLTSKTVFAFGFTAFLAGLHNLISTQSALATFNQPASATPLINGNALAAIAMGIYYSLAAYQENFAFFVCTVPMRLLTTFIFWTHNDGVQAWRLAAIWEGAGAVLTAAALVWDIRADRWSGWKGTGKSKRG